jgi:hypothetical protein
MTDPQVTIKLTADTRQADAAFKQVQAASATTANSLKAVAQQGQAASASLGGIGEASRREFDLAKKSLESTIRVFSAQTDEAEAYLQVLEDIGRASEQAGAAQVRASERATASAQKTLSVVEQYEAAYRQASDRASAFGDVGTAASTLAGAASGIGLGGAGQAGLLAADVFDSIEALDRVKVALKGVAEIAGSGQGVLGGLATAISGAIPGLSGTAAGVAAIGVAAGAFLAVGAAVGLAFAAISAAAEDARIKAEQLASQIVQQAQAQADAQELVASGDIVAALEERQRLSEDIARQRAAIDAVRAQRDAEVARLDQQRVLGFRGVSDLERQLGEELTALEESFLTVSTQFFELNRSLEDVDPALRAAAEATFEAAELQRAAATVAKQYGAATEQTTDAERELAAQREQAAQQLADLEKQEAALIRQFQESLALQREDAGIRAGRVAEDADLRARRAAEDLGQAQAEQARANSERLLSVERAGQAQIAALRQAAADRQVQAAQQVLAAVQATNAELLTAETAFNKDSVRQLEDFNRQRQQSERRSRQAIEDAVASNDVEAFLRARAERAQNRREQQDEFTTAQRRRTEDFTAEQAARRAALAERVAAIQAETAAFVAAQEARAVADQANLQNRLAAERAAIDAQIQRDNDRRAVQARREAEDAAIRDRRQAEDTARQEARQRAAFEARLAQINAEQAALQVIAGQVVQARNTELALLGQIISKAQTALTATPSAGGGFFNTLGTVAGNLAPVGQAVGQALKFPFAGLFDSGGVVPAGAPSFGLFGGKEREFVFTESQMRRMGGMGSNAPVSVNLTIQGVQVGALTTPEEARQIAVQVGEQVLSVVQQGLSMAVRGGQ